MNAANFHEYLKNPSMLHQVNYHELKSLALQYPYAANLRYLMLVKSLMDNKREYDRNLVLASLSSLDRKKLHQLVKQYSVIASQSEHYEIAEEFLELKDLSALEEVLEAGPGESTQPQQQAIPLDHFGSESDLEFLDELAAEPVVEEEDAPLAETPPAEDAPVLEELLGNEAAPESAPEALPAEESAPAEVPVSDIEEIVAGEPAVPEDMELEESLEGLFDNAAEELEPVSEQPETDPAPEAGEEETETAEVSFAAGEDAPLMEDLAAGESLESSAHTGEIPLEITNDEPAADPETDQPHPSPKASFSSYQRILPHKSGLLTGDIPVFRKATPVPPAAPSDEEAYTEPEDVAKEVAATSLSEDNTIATETLAGILERQGHVEKAIKMYEKLSLQFPEKSTTFAAKIEKLRKK